METRHIKFLFYLKVKDENKRLNTYLDSILAEIEERAPVLKRQREDYETAVNAVSSLTRQLEEARQENEFRQDLTTHIS